MLNSSSICFKSDLSSGARLLFCAVEHLLKVSGSNEVEISNKELSELLGIRPGTATQYRHELLNAGLLKQRRILKRGINKTFLSIAKDGKNNIGEANA